MLTDKIADLLGSKERAAEAPSPRLVTVRRVQWHNVWEFTRIFRAFRLAINPAKLTLALLALMLIYLAGRAFDVAWGPQAYRGEIEDYAAMSPEDFAAKRADWQDSRRSNLRDLLVEAAPFDSSLTADRIELLKDQPAAAYRAIRAAAEKEFLRDIDNIAKQRADDEQRAKDTSLHLADARTPEQAEQERRRRAADGLAAKLDRARDDAGHGIADTFMRYEMDQFDLLAANTLGLVRVAPASNAQANAPANRAAASPGGELEVGVASTGVGQPWRSNTIAGCMGNMFVSGPSWLFAGAGPMHGAAAGAGGWIKIMGYRGVYLASVILFALFSYVLLAFAGGSIARLSALELAGIERPLLKDVFAFTARRLWRFVKAPLAPLVILLAIGLLITIASLAGAIPGVGPILVGVFFFIAIAISFVLMLLTLGILGGFHLFYPAIAVEGSDSFDAMSRAFAYVYAQPWRLLFYTLLALVYGVLTFLFFAFAVYLLLAIAHLFVGWGTNLFGAHMGAYSGLPKLDTLWPWPTYLHLIDHPNWAAMSTGEYVGSLFLHFWVYLLATCVGAFVVSFYFSSHTIIYQLMRQAVEGQDVHEVFIEDAKAAQQNAER